MTRLVGLVLALAVLGLFGSCAAPTQIILHIHTDIPCSDARWQGIAIAVGEPDERFEKKAPASSSLGCGPNGDLGTIVLTPSGAKNAEVGLRVVAGLDRQPEECESHGYQGCVVARRVLRFDRQDTVHVDVLLAGSCIDFGCDSGRTCIDGACQLLSLVPNAPVDEPSGGGGSGNAGSGNPGAGKVRCGDNGALCSTTGDVCCLTVDRTAQTSTGTCQAAATCSNIVLSCDDPSDCPNEVSPSGQPSVCRLIYRYEGVDRGRPTSVSGSTCQTYADWYGQMNQGLGLCDRSAKCLNRYVCKPIEGVPDSPLPSYYGCEMGEL